MASFLLFQSDSGIFPQMNTPSQATLDGEREALPKTRDSASRTTPDSLLHEHGAVFAKMIQKAQQGGYYPFFQTVRWGEGAQIEVEGHPLIMLAANDYLGLARDPRVIEASVEAARAYGTSLGGSRFLCGNTALHEELEARLAAWIGKKKALIHATGYQTNLGILGAFTGEVDWILSDHENHASLLEGARASGAHLSTYRPQDAASAARKLDSIRARQADARVALVTDSLFSMSGKVAPLAELAALKEADPRLLLFVDEAHGLGVLGPGGRGETAAAGVTARTDFIMGTFSKAFSSIGGFVASDDEDALLYLKHQSKSLIFSAALPAMNVAAVLATLNIIQTEPERLERLRVVVRRARAAYREMGLPVPATETPILPIPVGEDIKACRVARALFDRGVFAMPALFPAVPRGQALVRTSFMSAHSDLDLDRIFEVLAEVCREENLPAGPAFSPQDAPHAERG